MDIQSRKLKAIRSLIGINDEQLLSKIEAIITEAQKSETAVEDVEPLTEQELLERAKRSNDDYAKGKIKTQDQLEEESKNW